MKQLIRMEALLTRAVLAVLCSAGANSVAVAQTVTLAPSKDNTLYESSTGNLSNGQGEHLFVGQTDTGGLRRALLAFDLSSIPANATITSATLTLFCSRSAPGSGATNVSLRAVARDWGEGASNAAGEEGAGAAAQAGDATWLHTFFNSSRWTAAGGDFSGTSSATTSVNAEGSYSWSGSGMVADIQAWLSNPATNFGWGMIGNEVARQTAKRFSSGESDTPPQLSVTYTVPATPTPTPTPTPTATPTPTPTPTPPQLLNISTRLRVEAGDNALIGGFIVTGNQPKRVILRAIGPSLTARGVADAVADPVLELRGPDGALLFQNDNWRSTQQTEIQNTGVPPEDDSESAIVATLPAAGYTAIVRGKGDTSGVGLVEAYDLERAADSRLANISTRGLVQTGTNVMIGGFIVGGDGTAKVIVRAIAPSLRERGVPNPLPDPTLQLFDRNGVQLEANDNWRDDPDQAEIAAAGIPPEHDLESALLSNIPPGAYTAVVAGKNSATGVALVEIYHLR